jgi:tetratricopeptide (TPR) repeat protein
LLAAFFAFVLYLPATQYGWVWDDQLLAAKQGLGGAAAEGFRPFAAFLYHLEYNLSYGTPQLSHLVSILLHALATWFFYWLAIRVGARPGVAFAAAVLFAAHPVHAEAVAYISGRPDLLATVLSLGALLLVGAGGVGGLVGAGGAGVWKQWLALALMAAAILSDEVALATPFVLVALDRWGPVRVQPRSRRALYAGFFAIAIVYAVVRFAGHAGTPPTAPSAARQSAASATAASAAGTSGTAESASGIDPGARSWAIPFAIGQYLRILAFPFPLNALRTLKVADVASAAKCIAPFVALALLAAFVWWRRRDPLARAGAILLFLPIIPALPLPHFVGSYAEDRAIYYGSVGFCFLVGSLYTGLALKWPDFRPTIAIATVVIAAVAAFATVLRIPVWHDNLSLLAAAAQADPHDPGPHFIMAQGFAANGQWDRAVAEVNQILAITPKDHGALARKAAFLSQMGKYPEAVEAGRQAVALDPHDAQSYSNLCDALLQTGKIDEAIDVGARAVAIDSTLVTSWYNYGVALSAKGDVDGAARAYRKAIEIQPTNALALNNLGALMGSRGHLEEARDIYLRLVQVAPSSVEAHMNLALAYLRLGDRTAAANERMVVKRMNSAALEKLDAYLMEYLKANPLGKGGAAGAAGAGGAAGAAGMAGVKKSAPAKPRAPVSAAAKQSSHTTPDQSGSEVHDSTQTAPPH